MKKQMILLFPLALLMFSCSGQRISKDKVPSLVLNTLKAKYPLANDVDWEKQGNLYEAELDINDSTEICCSARSYLKYTVKVCMLE